MTRALKGEVGQCGGCFTTIFQGEDFLNYRGGVFCVDCAIYTLKKKGRRDQGPAGRRSSKSAPTQERSRER